MAAGGLPERLKRLRAERGLTQIEVAEPKYSAAYISTIEAGRRNPSDAAIRHLADRLGVTARELTTGLPSSFEPEAVLALQEAWRELFQGSYALASKLFSRVERDARRLGHEELQARALVGRARSEERQGQTADALRLFTQALALFEEHTPLSHHVEAVAGIARCRQAAGETRQAAHMLEGYLLELERTGLPDPAALLRTYASLVWPYMELGLTGKASDVAARALKLQSRVDDPEQVAGMHLNVARVLLNDGKAQAALESLRRAEDIYSELNWKTELARARINRGMVHLSTANLIEAQRELEGALDVFEEVGFTREVARTLTELARVSRQLNDSAAARHDAQRAIELLSEMELIPELALAHRELALAVQDESSAKAKKHFQQAIDFYRKCGELLHAADTHRLLGELLEKEDPKKSWAEYKAGLTLVAQSLDRKD